MSDLLAKPLEQRLERLAKARDSMKPLQEVNSLFQNKCETVFSEFRISCVHLRKEREALDKVEQKEVATHFICRICRERPFLHDRCEEVLRILMLSNSWMRAFLDDPELDIEKLPPAVKEEFRKRAEEVKQDPGPGGGDPQTKDPNERGSKNPWSKDPREAREKGSKERADGTPSVAIGPAGGMRIVVQRCVRARLVPEDEDGAAAAAAAPQEIGRGLFVAVSFTQNAKAERIHHAAKFLLTSKLSTADKWQPGVRRPPSQNNEAESVVALCQRGESQGILLVPQESLASEYGEKDMDFLYPTKVTKDAAQHLYEKLVSELRSIAAELVSGAKPPVIVAGKWGEPPVLEIMSAGPYMHSFTI